MHEESSGARELRGGQNCCRLLQLRHARPSSPSPPAPEVPAGEEAGNRVAGEVVHPALLPQLRHDGINPARQARQQNEQATALARQDRMRRLLNRDCSNASSC